MGFKVRAKVGAPEIGVLTQPVVQADGPNARTLALFRMRHVARGRRSTLRCAVVEEVAGS